MRWHCKFHFRYVPDKILFTLQAYFAGACPLSFPSIFRSFRHENRIIVELFYWRKFRDRKENEIYAHQAKNTSKHMQGLRHSGREINHHSQKRRFLAYLQFFVDFLWIY